MASPTTPQPRKFDVFISFRGADIRTGFLSHLHEALVRNQIKAFVDENLDRGEDISSSLLEIIEQSHVSLVVFSENYAFSPWCLDELVKILECKKKKGQMVLPIFYRVDPTHVQELTGSFGDALAKHREEFKDSVWKVENWCLALKESAEMSGLVSHNIKSESKLIEEIVSHIVKKLNHVFASESRIDGFIGIDSRIKQVESLLCLESLDVRTVGIWGMGGIGKTTIAGKVFDQIYSQFTCLAFVGDVREKLEKCTPDTLQREILFQLFGNEISNGGIPFVLSSSIRKVLSRRKFLIVLDDLSDLKQIELLIGTYTDYGPGSRIIMTSRDKQLLKNSGAMIYEVEGLNESEAHSLFCLHAFKQNNLEKGFMELVERAVEYGQGNPLALKVLGSNLFGKNEGEWEDEMEKLKGTSDETIFKILRISYDGLSKIEKEIFLHIAFYFKGQDKDHVESIMGTPGSKIGISRLIDKSLIFVKHKKIHMHDLLQKMGKDIVCEEKQLEKRSWLWNPRDIYYVLTREKGTEEIRGIELDMSKIRDVELSPTAFERMYNLRFLKFYNSVPSEIKVHIPQGLKFLPDDLRLLYWYQYPLKSLPSSFCAENLVELHMPNSQLKELWTGIQNLGSLKLLDVRKSIELIRIPDLSRAGNLDILDLSWCESLVEIPSSVKFLSRLTELYLSYCVSLCSLPSFLHMKSLEFLSLCGCSRIREFPEVSHWIRELLIYGTAIRELPSSFGCQSRLWQLYLGLTTYGDYSADTTRRLNHYGELRFPNWNSGNLTPAANGSSINELPDSICNLKCLRYLDISHCVNLYGLPENFGDFEHLEKLIASSSGIKELPDSICNLKHLEHLDVSDCYDLYGLPESVGSLQSLEIFIATGSGIKQVPISIRRLTALKSLDFSKCQGLVLPPMTGGFFCLMGLRLKFCGIIESHNRLCSFTLSTGPYLGGNLKSKIESIKRSPSVIYLDPSSLNEIYTGSCKPLKSAFRSSQLIEELKGLAIHEFVNCINFDEDGRIMDHLLEIPRPSEEIQHWLRLCMPKSELPQKMMHQNKNGYSVSFPLRQLEQQNCTSLYLCAVYDPKVIPGCLIGCECYFRDECGRSYEGISYYWIDGESFLDIHYEYPLIMLCQTEHLFFWGVSFPWRLMIESLVQEHPTGSEGCKNGPLEIMNHYDVVFEFFAVSCEEDECRSDAITKCGVHLLSDNYEEEEHPSLQLAVLQPGISLDYL